MVRVKEANNKNKESANNGSHDLYSRTIQYDSANHFAVIFQIYGSVWPKVLPHCMYNLTVTMIILILQSYDINCTVSEFGHDFMSVIVAFLVVSRCTITFSLYFEFRGYCSDLYQAAREIPTLACVFTQSDRSPEAQKWRNDIALYSMYLLRTTTAVLTGKKAWEIEELPQEEKEWISFLPMDIGYKDNNEDDTQFSNSTSSIHGSEWYYGKNTLSDLNLRVPIRMSQKLRTILASQDGIESKLSPIEQQQLQDHVTSYMKGYNGIKKYLTTPFPFCLAGMTRTFLFFYVYTLPFALFQSDCPAMQTIILIFIVTYGYLGIEFVTIEIEDPFGTDPNDLPVEDEAKNVFDDIALLMMDIDGIETAKNLRKRMKLKRREPNYGSLKSSNERIFLLE